MNSMEVLLAALAGAPALPGARCRGKHHLFDPTAPGENSDVAAQRHAQALGLCSNCPALTRCEDWHDALPRTKRPDGVVAGRVNRPQPVVRPRRTA